MDMGNVQTIHRCSGIGTNDFQAQGLAIPLFDCHCVDNVNTRERDNEDEVAQRLKRERVGYMGLIREEDSPVCSEIFINKLDRQIPLPRVQQMQLPRYPSILRGKAHDFVAVCLPGRSSPLLLPLRIPNIWRHQVR
jgi:hypothetical protein